MYSDLIVYKLDCFELSGNARSIIWNANEQEVIRNSYSINVGKIGRDDIWDRNFYKILMGLVIYSLTKTTSENIGV